MALNPFEQLRLLASVSEPRVAFEEIVGILLKDHGRIDGQVKVYFGDAGVDAYEGTFGEGGALTVYQSKYFPDKWGIRKKTRLENRSARLTRANCSRSRNGICAFRLD